LTGSHSPGLLFRTFPTAALACHTFICSASKGGAANRAMPRTYFETESTVALYVVLMAAALIAVDLLFFRNRFWERLMVNTGIVLVFAAFYLRFLKHP
jgi:hypothetical protein